MSHVFSTADLSFCVSLSAMCSQQQILVSVSVCEPCVLNSRCSAPQREEEQSAGGGGDVEEEAGRRQEAGWWWWWWGGGVDQKKVEN